MTTRALASSAVAVVLLVSRAASAQAQYVVPDSPGWLSDRRYSEGIGIRTGDWEIHPQIGGEFGYDSNYLLRSTTQNVSNGPPNSPVIPSLEFRVTPALYLSSMASAQRAENETLTLPDFIFHAGANATYRAFIGVSSDPVASQSQNDIGSDQNVTAAADMRLDILPARPVFGAVFASYARSVLPNTQDANPDVSFNQDNVAVGGEIGIRPGSGTLDWHLGYTFSDTIFETDDGKPYDNWTMTAYTRGRWKFRPRTALVYDANLAWTNYLNPQDADPVNLQNSTPVRARIGLDGLITDRFAALAMIGWGASFYENPFPNEEQFDSVIAQAELRWFLAASPGIHDATALGLALSSISIGYTRDFQNSYLSSYYIQDRGYLRFYYLFGGRALVSLEGGIGAIEYPTLFWTDGTQRHSAFTDGRADVTLLGEYRFTDTLAINATLRYTAELSNTIIDVTENGAQGANGMPPTLAQTINNQYAMQWQRFEAFVGFRWFM
jgi:hypothetical protein